MSNDLAKVRGFVYKIYPTVSFKNDFTKREVVLEVSRTWKDKTFKSFPKFVAIKDKANLFDAIGIGSEVTIAYDIDGRMWKDPKKNEEVFFNDLKIVGVDIHSNTSQISQEPMATIDGAGINPIPDDMDLPF
jgi:hypothetical protein